MLYRWLSIYTTSYGIYTSIITLSIELYRVIYTLIVSLTSVSIVIYTDTYTSVTTTDNDDNMFLRRFFGKSSYFLGESNGF